MSFDSGYYGEISRLKKEGRVDPVKNQVYSLRSILETLSLADSPSLAFVHEGIFSQIQTAHMTIEQLLSVRELADSLWIYRYTSREWVPVFHLKNGQDVTTLVDLEMYEDEIYGKPSWWAIPKGFPRKRL